MSPSGAYQLGNVLRTGAIIVIEVTGWLVVFVADHFLRPLLIGSTTRLPFVWVLLGIFGGLETFGLIGVFLGPRSCRC